MKESEKARLQAIIEQRSKSQLLRKKSNVLFKHAEKLSARTPLIIGAGTGGPISSVGHGEDSLE
jgi:hypothetical protein